MLIVFCSLTNNYVALQYCKMIVSHCPHKSSKVWNSFSDLQADYSRPMYHSELVVKRPMACQLNKSKIILRSTNM